MARKEEKELAGLQTLPQHIPIAPPNPSTDTLDYTELEYTYSDPDGPDTVKINGELLRARMNQYAKLMPEKSTELETESESTPTPTRTLHIATDGSVRHQRGRAKAAASFVALEDKMAFYNDKIHMPSYDTDPNTEDYSFIPEFAACTQAIEYAQQRLADGAYDNVEIYTDNTAALAVAKYIMDNGPVDLRDTRQSLKTMVQDDNIHFTCVEFAKSNNLRHSPLRYLFSDLNPQTRGFAQKLGLLSDQAQHRYEETPYTFEHVKAHNEDYIFNLDPHNALKTELNVVADEVATQANKEQLARDTARSLAKRLDKEFDDIMFRYDQDPGWAKHVGANVAGYTSDQVQRSMVANDIFVAEAIQEGKASVEQRDLRQESQLYIDQRNNARANPNDTRGIIKSTIISTDKPQQKPTVRIPDGYTADTAPTMPYTPRTVYRSQPSSVDDFYR